MAPALTNLENYRGPLLLAWTVVEVIKGAKDMTATESSMFLTGCSRGLIIDMIDRLLSKGLLETAANNMVVRPCGNPVAPRLATTEFSSHLGLIPLLFGVVCLVSALVLIVLCSGHVGAPPAPIQRTSTCRPSSATAAAAHSALVPLAMMAIVRITASGDEGSLNRVILPCFAIPPPPSPSGPAALAPFGWMIQAGCTCHINGIGLAIRGDHVPLCTRRGFSLVVNLCRTSRACNRWCHLRRHLRHRPLGGRPLLWGALLRLGRRPLLPALPSPPTCRRPPRTQLEGDAFRLGPRAGNGTPTATPTCCVLRWRRTRNASSVGGSATLGSRPPPLSPPPRSGSWRCGAA